MKDRLLLFQLIAAILVMATVGHNADWMRGKWGIGYRVYAGGFEQAEVNGKTVTVIHNRQLRNYDFDGFIQQVTSIPGISWVIVNLSQGAYGDLYTAYHPILHGLNRGSTPGKGVDDFILEMGTRLQAVGIKLIAYAAAQGPAMLKHGYKQAYDYAILGKTCDCSPALNRWIDHVNETYPDYDASADHKSGKNLEIVKKAYAEIIIKEYAQRYGSLIAGWWFDQGKFADLEALYNATMPYNPDAVLAFNNGDIVPLVIQDRSAGLEHFTAGHPTRLQLALPSNRAANEPLITSIENATGGYISASNGKDKSLGHAYMPVADKWNTVRRPLVWNVSHAAEWKSRVLAANGAWTWNIPRWWNNLTTWSLLDPKFIEFVVDVENAIGSLSASTPAPSSSLSANPSSTSEPSSEPSRGPTSSLSTNPSSSSEASTNKPSSGPSSLSANPSSSNPSTGEPSSEPSDKLESCWSASKTSTKDRLVLDHPVNVQAARQLVSTPLADPTRVQCHVCLQGLC